MCVCCAYVHTDTTYWYAVIRNSKLALTVSLSVCVSMESTSYPGPALIIRIGFGGPLYYNYNKDPPQNSIGPYYPGPDA